MNHVSYIIKPLIDKVGNEKKILIKYFLIESKVVKTFTTEIEEEGEIFDKVSEQVSLLQILMSLKRKNLSLTPHKIIQDVKSDPIWFIQKLLEKTSFSPQEVSDLCSMCSHIGDKKAKNLDSIVFVTAAKISAENNRHHDAIEFCKIIVKEEFHENGGWEICLSVLGKTFSKHTKRSLLNFTIDWCDPDKIPEILNQIDELCSDDDDDMEFFSEELIPGNALGLISAGVKRIASNDSDSPPPKKLKNLSFKDDKTEIQQLISGSGQYELEIF